MPKPQVIYIPGKRKLHHRNAAAYCRVSTMYGQEDSYDEQVQYYTELIKNDPDLIFAGIYADEGISGTQAKTRPELMRMLQDCKDGKIDLIYVKSISRLSRNVADCKRIVDELNELGVEVYFEKENISTSNPTMSMIFMMMSMIAENESRSISQNVHWSFVKKAERGEYHVNDNSVLGYSNVDGKLTPNEDAWMVKLVYEEFLKGATYRQIAEMLAAKGGVGIHSGKPLTVAAIPAILSNELYVGDKILQKQPPKNYLTHKPDPTIPAQQFLVTDGHTPIVDRETWNKVQEKLKERKKIRKETGCNVCANSHPLYGKVICGACGAPFMRKKQTYKGVVTYVWICKNRRKKLKDDEDRCYARIIREEDLLKEIKKLLPVRRFRKDQYHPQIWERLPADTRVYVFDDHLELRKIEADPDDAGQG